MFKVESRTIRPSNANDLWITVAHWLFHFEAFFSKCVKLFASFYAGDKQLLRDFPPAI